MNVIALTDDSSIIGDCDAISVMCFSSLWKVTEGENLERAVTEDLTELRKSLSPAQFGALLNSVQGIERLIDDIAHLTKMLIDVQKVKTGVATGSGSARKAKA